MLLADETYAIGRKQGDDAEHDKIIMGTVDLKMKKR